MEGPAPWGDRSDVWSEDGDSSCDWHVSAMSRHKAQTSFLVQALRDRSNLYPKEDKSELLSLEYPLTT